MTRLKFGVGRTLKISNMKKDKRDPGSCLARPGRPLPCQAPNRPQQALEPLCPPVVVPGEIRAKGKSDGPFLPCAASPHQILFDIFPKSRCQHSPTAPGTFRHHPSRARPISCVSNAKPGFSSWRRTTVRPFLMLFPLFPPSARRPRLLRRACSQARLPVLVRAPVPTQVATVARWSAAHDFSTAAWSRRRPLLALRARAQTKFPGQIRGKKTRTTVKLQDLPQGPLGAPLEPLDDGENQPAYPTVVMQARRNMQKFDDCVVLTRVGGFYELYFEHAEEYGPLLNLKVAQKKTNAGHVSMVNSCFSSASMLSPLESIP